MNSEEVETALAQELQELFDAAEGVGRELTGEQASDSASRRELELKVRGQLRTRLNRDIALATPLTSDGAIEEIDLDVQIARAALRILDKQALQEACVKLGLLKTGGKELLIDRLLGRIGFDDRDVARLIASVERAPIRGRRHASWIVRYPGPLPIDAMVTAVEPLTERYIQTEMTRWFVVRDVGADDQSMRISAELRSLDLQVLADSIEPTSKTTEVILEVGEANRCLTSRSRDESSALAGVDALGTLTGMWSVPPFGNFSPLEAVPASMAIDAQTAWTIGVLRQLVQAPGIGVEDITSVSFERRPVKRLGGRTSHVGSSSLHGQHVLDSPQACRHIAQGEQVRAVTALMRFSGGSGPLLPVRIALGSGDVAVMTGFGGLGADAALPYHVILRNVLAKELQSPNFDYRDLNDVLETMLQRATDAAPSSEATLFVQERGQHSELSTR